MNVTPGAGDVDGDTREDLVLGAFLPGDCIGVMFQDSSGALGRPAYRHVADSVPGGGLSVGDLNGDGKLDVVGTSIVSEAIFVLLNERP